MNQKKLKYPLIIGTALVWSLIIYRIVKGLGNEDRIAPLTASQKKIDYNQPADSFILVANYPDPFIPAGETVDSIEVLEMPNNATVNPASVPAQPEFDPSIIQYTGMISNPVKKIKVAILNIAGREYLAREKEKIADYLVKSIQKDKIVIFYKGNSYTIQKSK